MIDINFGDITIEDNRIFGIINFKTTESYFPSEDWNDFIIIIMNWWTDAMINIMSNETDEVEFSFMDGPYSLKLHRNGLENLSITFFEQGKQVFNEQTINSIEFLILFMKRLNEIIRELQAKGIANDEVVRLNLLYHKLQFIKNILIKKIKY